MDSAQSETSKKATQHASFETEKLVPHIGTGTDFEAIVATLKGAIERGEIDKENVHRLAHGLGIKPEELASMVGVDKDTIQAKDQDDSPENRVNPPQVSKTFKDFRSETRSVPTEIPCNDELPHASVTESVMLAGEKVGSRPYTKDMWRVANRIASLRPEERAKHHDEAARYFQNNNPRFNAQKFHAACFPKTKMNESGHPALNPSSGNKMTSDPREAEKLKTPETMRQTMARVRRAAKDAMRAKALQKESANQTNESWVGDQAGQIGSRIKTVGNNAVLRAKRVAQRFASFNNRTKGLKNPNQKYELAAEQGKDILGSGPVTQQGKRAAALLAKRIPDALKYGAVKSRSGLIRMRQLAQRALRGVNQNTSNTRATAELDALKKQAGL